jgi:hypothetical protein
MATEPTHGSPLEIRLSDGSRMIVDVAVDGDGSAGAEVAVAVAVVTSGEEGSALAAAIDEVVEELGLSVSTATERSTTRITVS